MPGFDGRRGEADFIRVPPRSVARFQHELVIAPVAQVRGKRYPHVRAGSADRAMDQSPLPTDTLWKQGRIFIFRRHDDAVALEAVKIVCERQRYARPIA